MPVVKADDVRSEINVTPLVDVVLVLLIIFMVVAPMLQRGPAVKLPLATHPPEKPDDSRQLLVAIQHDRAIWLHRERLTEELFADRIREAFRGHPGSSVVIRGDARLSYGDVKRVMLEVKAAGFPDVGLIVEKRGAGP
jgi:biopolymer transport protein ExbD